MSFNRQDLYISGAIINQVGTTMTDITKFSLTDKSTNEVTDFNLRRHEPKEIHDTPEEPLKIQIAGYHANQGLSFEIQVSIREGANREEIENFVLEHFASRMQRYAEELAAKPRHDNTEQNINDFVINQSLPLHHEIRALAISIVYENNQTLQKKLCLFERGRCDRITNPETILPVENAEIENDITRIQRVKNIYQQERARLEVLLQAHTNNKKFLDSANRLKKIAEKIALIENAKGGDEPSKEFVEITSTLASLNRAIANPDADNLKDFNKRAANAKNKSSRLWKILGIAMMVVGSLMIAAGVALAIATAPGIVTPASPLAAVSVGVGAGIAGAGLVCVTAGVGFFYHGKKKDPLNVGSTVRSVRKNIPRVG